MSTSSTSLPVLVDRYRVVDTLASSADSIVEAAVDRLTGQAVVLKRVDRRVRPRLEFELEALRSVAHPLLPRVLELLDVDSEQVALVETLAPGMRSDDALGNVPLQSRVRAAGELALSTCRALAALHGSGLVHGDVKPSNVVAELGAFHRAMLVDLGFASRPGPAARISGTPRYLAPESWIGERSVATDLYALGVTLTEWLGGDPSGDPVYEALGQIARSLRSEDPFARPSSAREVARQVARALGVPAPILDEPSAQERAARIDVLPLTGRASELAALIELLEREAVVELQGPRGAGKHRLLVEAIRVLQTKGHSRTWIPEWTPDQTVECDAFAATRAPMTVEAARAEARAAALRGHRLTLVLHRRLPRAPQHRAPGLTLGPIPSTDIHDLYCRALDHSPTKAASAAAFEASMGLPGRLCRQMKSILLRGLDPERGDSFRALRGTARELDGPEDENARHLWATTILLGNELSHGTARSSSSSPASLASSISVLELEGWARRSERGLMVDGERSMLSEKDIDGALVALRRLPTTDLSDLGRACVQAAREENDAARLEFVRVAERSIEAGAPWAAARIVELAQGHLGESDSELCTVKAEALRLVGDLDNARETLSNVPSSAPLRAELLRLAGRHDEALRELDARSIDGDLVRGRVLLSRGKHAEAEAIGRHALEAASSREQTVRAHELLTMIASARGEHRAAVEHATEARNRARQLEGWKATQALARIELLLGNEALTDATAQGRTRAAAHYGEAVARAAAIGDARLEANAAINAALVELEDGRWGRALPLLRRGASRAMRVSSNADLSRALYNLGNLAFFLGDHDLASEVVEQLARAARVDPETAEHVALLSSELFLRKGQFRAAAEALSKVASTSRLAALARVRKAMLHLALGERSRVLPHLEDAREHVREQQGDELAEIAIAYARLALDEGAAPVAEHWAQDARASARTFEVALRAELIGIESAEALALRNESQARSARVRLLLDRAAEGLDAPALHRFRSVAHYRKAFSVEPLPSSSSVRANSSGHELIEAASELLRVTSRSELRREFARLARALSGGERAFLLSASEASSPEVLATSTLASQRDERPSTTIVSRAARERRTVMSVDALAESLLASSASVHAMSLRSVIALPCRLGPKRTVLYVDDRLRPSAFDDETARTLEALTRVAESAAEHLETRRSARLAARDYESRERRLTRLLDAARAERKEHSPHAPFSEIVSASPAMKQLIALAERIAKSEANVLISGESGTGKELIAREIHRASSRADRPFIVESCASIPEALLESTLFGHVRGAFTGADRRRSGLFELANGGTLVLDGVERMSDGMQARFLRVLQEGTIRPVGSEREHRVDVRVISCSSEPLFAAVEEERFRADLFYRLAVLSLEVPPLRDRTEDLPGLIEAILRKEKRASCRLDPEAMDALSRHGWPGNVRELENELARALLMTERVVRREHLSLPNTHIEQNALLLRPRTERLERELVTRALALHAGNRTRAAEALGVSRFGLAKMCKRLGI